MHFEVPTENADALAGALRGLESSGLRVVIAGACATCARRTAHRHPSWSDPIGPASCASCREALRTAASASRLHTEIVNADSAGHTFKVKALLMVPDALTNPDLQRLESSRAR